jgi:ABC-type multidrug transport system ATPase subunit
VSLLRLDSVTTYYGEIRILEDVSLEVGEGELVCLLGGNASGKSTTLKTILGLVRPRADQRPDRPRHGDRSREPAPVRPLTVEENLELGAYLRDAWRTRARRSSASSRACASGAPSSPERSPAASSRWLRWGGR